MNIMKVKNTPIAIFILININLLFINEIKSQYAIAGTQGAIYVDIVPDTLLNSPPPPGGDEYYYIDINQDGIDDIKIDAGSSISPGVSYWKIDISSLDSFTSFSLGNIDSVMNGSNLCGYFSMLQVFNNGDTIKNTNYVSQGYLGYAIMVNGGCTGVGNEWVNKGDKFFGVKYQTAVDTTFGWVKVNVADASTVLIEEFSLGSPVAGINSTHDFSKLITVYPNPTTEKIYLLQNTSGEIEISLFDVYGKQSGATFKSRTQKTEMDLSGLTMGIYFVQVKTDDGIATKKIIIHR